MFDRRTVELPEISIAGEQDWRKSPAAESASVPLFRPSGIAGGFSFLLPGLSTRQNSIYIEA
jgi:hypothetical protein